MVVGESKRFDYTGNIQTIVLEPGKYKLECYGAQGYAILNGTGGKGGYAQGEIIIRKKETLYICVGGLNTGYNGGEGDVPGGGATHIARRTGLLKTLVNYKDLVLIVAGGGDGVTYAGGAGGGSSYISHSELQNASTTTGVRIGNRYAIITLLDDNKRKNSNLYKDSYNQETFDFNKLLEV